MSEDGSPSRDEKIASWRFLRQIEVNQTLTALYLIIEASRWQHSKGEDGFMRESIGWFKSTMHSHFLAADIHECSWPWSFYPDGLDKNDGQAAVGRYLIYPASKGTLPTLNFDNIVLTSKPKGCSPVLENITTTLWRYDRIRREQGRSTSRNGHQ